MLEVDQLIFDEAVVILKMFSPKRERIFKVYDLFAREVISRETALNLFMWIKEQGTSGQLTTKREPMEE